MSVYFEDLVMKNETEISRLCDFLGLSKNIFNIDLSKSERNCQLWESEKENPNIIKIKNKLSKYCVEKSF